MKVYNAKNYVEFISHILTDGKTTIPRGRIKAVSDHLQCHPSFLSQILRSKAHMSHEQALRFCSYVKFNEDEAEFFIDLLNHDRAGSEGARLHFRRIIRRKLRERNSLQKRAHLVATLSREQEILYFQSITHALVHAALHLALKEPKQLALALDLPESEVAESLRLLEELGLAVKENEMWNPTQKALHIGKASPLNRSFHINWRLKTAAHLLEARRTNEHTHFSSVFCVSHADVERIREMILNHLELVRKEMVISSSERLVALCLDYFPIR